MKSHAEREKLEARLAELISANEAATGCGAAVGARHEEIKEIKSRLRQLPKTQQAGERVLREARAS